MPARRSNCARFDTARLSIAPDTIRPDIAPPRGVESAGCDLRGGLIASTILVINPNSTERITEHIRRAVGDVDRPVEVVTSPNGPAAIESDADVAAAVAPMLQVAAAHPAGAYVVACFSDPGLQELRRTVSSPAFGIAESAIMAALERGRGVGVISSVADSVPRHERYWARLGVTDRILADIPLGIGVLELDTPSAHAAALATGNRLVAAGCDVVVLGCTGMAHMVEDLQTELGVPVVEPCRAAVVAAGRTLEEVR